MCHCGYCSQSAGTPKACYLSCYNAISLLAPKSNVSRGISLTLYILQQLFAALGAFPASTIHYSRHQPADIGVTWCCMSQGTLTHMAPEILLHGRASKASDVYGFGILLWEMCTGGRAFQGMPIAMVAHAVANKKKRPQWVAGCHAGLMQLAELCWAQDPAARCVCSMMIMIMVVVIMMVVMVVMVLIAAHAGCAGKVSSCDQCIVKPWQR